MKTMSFLVNEDNQWTVPAARAELDSERTLVLCFGSRKIGSTSPALAAIGSAFPRSKIVGCSTAGEIHGGSISDNSVSVAVARFDDTELRLASARVASAEDSHRAGAELAAALAGPGLRAVFVLSEGLHVNGSQLIRGINAGVGDDVIVTGGLAGDGDRFEATWVLESGAAKDKTICAVGFYGDRLRVGHGSKGGWDSFGLPRSVTKSAQNVLFELNGRPALDVYREYLGELASGLPATALLFPLSLRRSGAQGEALVRTVLSIDESARSMTFAGDIPEGAEVQFMRADFDRLIEGASDAARLTNHELATAEGSLSIAISCVGRRLVLGERAEEEVESALEHLPPQTTLVGFYSYGELSPHVGGRCDLHNQTMTLTTFAEVRG